MEETMENLKREGKEHELFASGEAREGRDKGGRAEGVSRGFPQAASSPVWVSHCCPDKGSPVPPHNCSLSASLSILAADSLPIGSLSAGTEWGCKVAQWGRMVEGICAMGCRDRSIWWGCSSET